MGWIYLRFHGCLNDFLPLTQREQTINYWVKEKTALKHIIESLGVPHPEVGYATVNGYPQPLTYHVQDGDDIHVHPFTLNGNDASTLDPRFVLDNHLGKLTHYLRLLGFDALYDPNWQDRDLALIANREDRILLTRDRGLLKRNLVRRGYCVRAHHPREQVFEIINRFNLKRLVNPFQRCPRCNGLLESVRKQDILDRLEPLTRLYYDEFDRCTQCGQIYWKGSHYERMLPFIEKVLNYCNGDSS